MAAQPATTRIRVFVDIDETPVPVGIAYASQRGDHTTVTFAYDDTYQADGRAYSISPDLPLRQSQHVTDGLPKAFGDSAPDRWGRNLIRKRHQALHRSSGTARTVGEVDYLLGVSDATRQGALRYTLDDNGPFQADDIATGGVPKIVALPELLAAADKVARDPDAMTAIKILLDAGTGTLGGARPKASVRDNEQLLIAKFPHHSDDWDVMAWEKTTLDLAAAAGINTPPSRLALIENQHVLLLDRFDRQHAATTANLGGRRLPYISAMTLIGADDGTKSDYLELAEALTLHGAAVNKDLAQLWRRIAFSLIVNNTDDHMRNHGFLHTYGGWTLSPAFDINPEPDINRHRASTIGFTDQPAGTKAALMDNAAEFRLKSSAAASIWDEVLEATANWRDVATSHGIPERELTMFAPALDRYR
ncbi:MULTISPECIES: type II toxin-antitoxin system HipA family toxin [unclassified Aeromicrobium]|uniref:type II toxin-antitoxin system HipA family toxin n=1 Tax=unclassified Aeromicrobium TaxID=2633570 RepID=UPI00288C62E5|nr:MULTISPECIES: type II toxin-antitoxin system HipA family toxin [unclassified Aeromicrobium]